MKEPSNAPQGDIPKSRYPLWWGIIGNILNFLLSLELYSIPVGSDIRPMMWACWILLVGLACLVPFFISLEIIWTRPKQIWPWFAALLSITPYPLACLMLRHAMALRGLHLSP
jgi:hypothetical protein